MPAQPVEWTLEMLHALPDDGNRYELVDGELLVSPSPSRPHQRMVRRLCVLLDAYLQPMGGMEVLFAPFAVTFSLRRELQPDLMVLPVPGRPGRFGEVDELELAVEVLSPSTARYDRVTKRRVYQEQGVPEYWIVDLDARLVERWRPGIEQPEILTERLTWRPVEEREEFAIDLVALFRDVLD